MDDGNNYQSDDEMDEDEDVVADEMDYGEEDGSDSENTSIDSDEIAHDDELDLEPHSSDEDGWNDEDEDDEVQDEDEDDESQDEGDTEDHLDIVAGDQEIAWQVTRFCFDSQEVYLFLFQRMLLSPVVELRIFSKTI